MTGHHGHDDIEAYLRRHGYPIEGAEGLSQYTGNPGLARRVNLNDGLAGFSTPPHAGDGGQPRCCHCGTPVAEGRHAALHAVAGAEGATHPQSGAPLRLRVFHCDACRRGPHCDPDTATPGSGYTVTAAGFCEFVRADGEVVLNSGLPFVAWFLKRAVVGAAALYVLSLGAIQTSQGQQVADNQGGSGSIGASSGSDSTAGHGYNGGALRVYSGSAPATGNSAATGTKGVDQTLPGTCFGTASAALPSVLTANAISNTTILATITAGYGRMVAAGDDDLLSTTERRIMFAVGTSGSDMNLNTLALVSGGTFSTTSLVISHGL